ncbi:MAG: YhdP family protein [Pseudomonadota bacterium]
MESRRLIQRTWRYLRATLLYALVALVILAGVLLGVSRLLTPMVNERRAEIEQRLSTALERPLKLGAIEMHWRGLSPVLLIKDVTVLDKHTAQPLLRIDAARVAVNIPRYLRTGRLERGRLEVSGTTLTLVRHSDGTITVEGFPEANGVFLDWLLAQKELALQDSVVAWRDEQQRTPALRFSDVDARLKTRGQRHQVDLALSPPGAAGQRLSAALDFTGALTEPSAWRGEFYARGAGVQPTQWWPPPAFLDISVLTGVGDFQLWGAWQGGALQSLEGDVTTRALALRAAHESAAPVQTFNHVNGQLFWQRAAQGWTLDVTRLIVKRDDTPSPPMTMKITAADAARVEARIDTARLEDVNGVLLASGALGAAARDALHAARPRGALRDVYVRVQDAAPGQEGGAGRFYVQTRLADLDTRSWKAWPALTGMGGLLRADERGGTFDLDARLVKLDFGSVFRAPLGIDTVVGRVSWQQAGSGWRVFTKDLLLRNADLNAKLSGAAEWSAGENAAPLLDVTVNFDNGNVANTSRYLPVGVMAPDVARWLERALVSGRVTSGAALLRGRLSDFPFSDGQGEFEVRFNVADLLLDYEPGWPWIGEMEAGVLFRGRALEIEVAAGKIFDAQIQQAHAAIADLTVDEPHLQVVGQVRGASGDALRFVKESPLKERFGAFIDRVSAEGRSVLDINLLVPLSPTPNRVQGKLALVDTTLRYAGEQKNQNIVLTNVNGALQFTENSFSGKDIAATLWEQKLRMAVATQSDAAGRVVSIDARAKMTPQQVFEHVQRVAPDFKVALADRFKGASEWLAALRLREDAAHVVSGELNVTSDLQGTGVDLPEPLGKPAEQALLFSVKTDWTDAPQKNVSIHYGDRLSGAFEAAQVKNAAPGGAWELRRGALHLGGGAATLPAQGLRVSGSLPRFSWSEWNNVLPASGKSGNGGFQQRLDAVDVRIGALEAFNQQLTDAQIKAAKTAQEWTVQLSSAQVAGVMHLPHADNAVWVMDFERLHLAKAPDQERAAQSTDPRRAPPLAVSSNSFKYGDFDLGALNLKAGKRPAGLHFDKLTLASPTLNIDGQGEWLVVEKDRQISSFSLVINSAQAGKALSALGYSSVIEGGEAHLTLTASWPGAPMDFAAKNLNGALVMNIEKGRLLDVEPGAGRVFGLLSLQALPRRLTLDFSDLFAKGFAFDHITGRFNLENGNAYTNDLVMEGPSAIINIAGRTGLAAKDYDQLVTVKPQIGASLPLLGGLAGGPAGLAAVFIAKELFKPQIEQIAGYQYTIKGSWQDPQIERVTQASVNGGDSSKETNN